MDAWLPTISFHSLVIVVSVLVYVLTTRAQRERRPPSIAIAWVLGLIALPYVVLPMYLMFGRRKLPRRIVQHRALQNTAGHWAQDLIESFGLADASPAVINMHQDGRDSAAALFSIMAGAVSRLDICTFILGDDPFGRKVMQLLIERARSGTEVRLLLDGVGALQLPRACLESLQSGGVETEIFSPLFARKTQGPRNLRNHRKLVIADGTRLWAGGRNFAAEYFSGAAGEPAWRDLTFDLQGPVVGAAAAQFELDWVAAGGKPAASAAAVGVAVAAPLAAPVCAAVEAGTAAVVTAAAPAHTSLAQFLPSGPDQAEDTVHALLIDACFHARERILAATPYFVPDVSLETAMRLAARRGVRIDLCMPNTSNHRLADFARNRALRNLSQAGVNFHLLPYMSHAKAVILDHSLAFSGSVNLDSRSLLLNYECAVVFYGAAEIDWLAQWIDALIADAAPFHGRPPGLLRDLCEGLLLTVAYQL
jgi:cardiolipin synthase A/B